jgi:sugar/nucleoside kinase (ribokinase family)
MPGRGPAPKDAARRARRNAQPNQTVLTFTPCPQPPLPEGYPWPERTRQWWRAWGDAPQAGLLTEVDWEFLADTALLHATVWASADAAIRGGGKIDTSHLPELRLRVAKLGATLEDRARLRIMFAEADEKDSKRPAAGSTSRERYGDLRVLPGAASSA